MTVATDTYAKQHVATGVRLAGGRWAGIAGLTYVLAWLIGLGIGMSSAAPGPAASADALGAFFSAHRISAMVQAYFLDGLAGAALIVFAGAIHVSIRRAEGESNTLGTIALAAGIAAGTVSLVQGLFTQVLADQVAAMGNLATTRALYDLNTEGDTFKLLVIGVFIGAISILGLRTSVLPRWINLLGIVVAPLLVVSGWNFVLSTSAQYAAYAVLLLVLLVWTGAVSVVALRRAA
jgi:hypothetical protein